MIDFFIILITFTQFPILILVGTRIICKTLIYATEQRNPTWLAENPQVRFHLKGAQIITGFSYVFAFASALFCGYIFFSGPEWVKSTIGLQRLPFLVPLYGPLFLWLFSVIMPYAIVNDILIWYKIPLPDVRRASLKARKLTDHVPRWVLLLAFGSCLAFIAVYGWVWYSGMVSGNIAGRRMIGISIVILIAAGVLKATLFLKESQLGPYADPKYGIRVAVSVLFLSWGVFIYRVIGDGLLGDTSLSLSYASFREASTQFAVVGQTAINAEYTGFIIIAALIQILSAVNTWRIRKAEGAHSANAP